MAWPIGEDRLRQMYVGGRADKTARAYARLWSAVFAVGFLPKRWVTLEVVGRQSRQRRRFPLGMADVDGQWYLVSMLGTDCNWVKNVRGADGEVVLRQRWRSRRCRLVEVPEEDRAPILRRYVQKVPGARPHIPVAPSAPIDAFEAVAGLLPVFLVPSRTAPVPASASKCA